MPMVAVGFGFTEDRTILDSIGFAEVNYSFHMEDIHTIHSYSWDLVSSSVIVVIG